MRRLIIMALGATALATTSVANATAFVGSTGGCFGTSCTPTSTASLVSGGATLSFASGTFNQVDSNGFLAIGSGNPPTDTLGLFTLTGTTGTSTFNSPFTLLVNFTSPTGVAGVPSTASSFFSTITGSVTDTNAGGVFVNFDNTAHLFNSNSGPFTLTVNDLGVSNNGLATPITGQITAVPEAKTWALMLLGFAGIGFAMRRGRRPVLAQVA